MLCDLPERRLLSVRMEVGERTVSDVRHAALGQAEVSHLIVLDAAHCGHGLKHSQ